MSGPVPTAPAAVVNGPDDASSDAARTGVDPAAPTRGRERYTRFVLVALSIAVVPYLWVLWGGRLDPLRTALPSRAFSNFYDLQARALFHGHWSVPKGSLGVEAFVINGKQYTYFGPFPSLLRMPILAVTHSLDGRLTAPSLLLAWIVTAVFTALLVWRVRVLARGAAALGRAEAASLAVFAAAIASGSVVLYLASQPFVYHEDFAWGVALGIATLFALIGVLEQPSRRRVVLTGLLALAAVLSRQTIGWGCILAVVAAGVWFAVRRTGDPDRRWAAPLLAAGLVPLAIGSLINWIKLRVLFGLPMQDQVFTQVNAHRRQVLAANGNKLWSFKFVPSTVWAYLQPTGIRFTPVYPFITLPGSPARGIAGAVLDQTYRTTSLPASAPLLLLLAVGGLVVALTRRPPGRAHLLRIPLFGAAAATAGVFLWGYLATRYLSDLIPFAALAGALALVEVWRRLEGRAAWARRAAAAVIGALALYGLLANLAMASIPTVPAAWDGARAQRYVRTQRSVSDLIGYPYQAHVRHGARLPTWAPADQVFIVGNCDGLYVSTGEHTDTWIDVEHRDLDTTLRLDAALAGPPVPLFTVGSDPRNTLLVEGDGHGRIRFRVLGSLFRPGGWLTVGVHRTHRLAIGREDASAAHVQLQGRTYVAVTLDGQDVFSWPEIGTGPPALVPHPAGASPLVLAAGRTPAPPLCRSLLPTPTQRAPRVRSGHRPARLAERLALVEAAEEAGVPTGPDR